MKLDLDLNLDLDLDFNLDLDLKCYKYNLTNKPIHDYKTLMDENTYKLGLFLSIRQKEKNMISEASRKKDFSILKREFPHFDMDTLPVIPIYWHDTSWHHNSCPSFKQGRFDIFVQDLDRSKREFPLRFIVIEEGGDETTLTTNDWAEVLDHINSNME